MKCRTFLMLEPYGTCFICMKHVLYCTSAMETVSHSKSAYCTYVHLTVPALPRFTAGHWMCHTSCKDAHLPGFIFVFKAADDGLNGSIQFNWFVKQAQLLLKVELRFVLQLCTSTLMQEASWHHTWPLPKRAGRLSEQYAKALTVLGVTNGKI